MHSVTDFQCVLSMDLDNPLPEMTRKFGIYLQTNIFMKGDDLIVIHSLPEEMDKSRETAIFLNQFGARKLDNIWSIKHNPGDERTESFIKNLINVKSVVLDDINLNKGIYGIIFRFNRRELPEVSAVLMQGLQTIPGLNIEYLGKSPKLLNTFRNIDSFTPLAYVEIDCDLPGEEIERKMKMPLGKDWSREIKVRTMDRGLRAVYHIHDDEKQIDESKVNTISSKDRIYEYLSDNPLLNFWSKQLYENSVTIMWLFQKFKVPQFRTGFVLPRFFMPQFLKIIESSVKEFPDWNIRLEVIQDIRKMD